MITKERNTGIGGTDAAGICGLSRWKTPLSVWAEKTGQYETPDEPTLAKTLGVRLEEVVAELYTERTGKKLARVNERIVHPKYPFINGRIDRRIVGERAIAECKTASAYKAKEWESEEIPQEYIIQGYHYLALNSEWEYVDIPVLIGNQDFKIKRVERDERVISDLIAKEVYFWEKFVVPRVMPSQVTAKDAETLYGLYPLAVSGSEIELGDGISQQIESRNSMIQDVKALESQIERTENEIRAALKDQELGRTSNWIVTWKNQITKRLDTGLIKEKRPDLYEQFLKEVPSRVLRIKEIKNGNG